MLVIHWAKQNRTSPILKNGITPSSRRRDGQRIDRKGVYVYPFSRNKTLSGNWRRNLKCWDSKLGNYNGFIFRLLDDDFPLTAGYWFFNRSDGSRSEITSLNELAEKYGAFFSGSILTPGPVGIEYDWEDFEIVIPRLIAPNRIIKVIRDREPVK